MTSLIKRGERKGKGEGGDRGVEGRGGEKKKEQINLGMQSYWKDHKMFMGLILCQWFKKCRWNAQLHRKSQCTKMDTVRIEGFE